MLAEMGKYEDAAVYLERAAEGLPGWPRLYYNLALVRQRQGRMADAEAIFLYTIELDPDNLDFMYALADHYIKRGLLQKALEVAERMIALEPQNRLGHDIKAHVENELR